MKLTMVGYGMSQTDHLTIEAIRKINESKAVLVLGRKEGLLKLFKNKLIIDLNDEYRNGEIDNVNYARLIKVVFQFVKRYDNISFIVPGHPRLAVSLTNALQKKSKRDKISFDVIAGVSSFDTMINDLQIDPLEAGTTLIDANRMILFKAPLIVTLNVVIYHISSIGNNKTDFLNPSFRNKLILLFDYLSRFYSENKILYIIKSKDETTSRSNVKKIRLKNLLHNRFVIDFASSLFIPAEEPIIINKSFLKKLQENGSL
jgi:uncharacterized protein YabN with tetrapyrrole methylase and pyrophosphatase domain